MTPALENNDDRSLVRHRGWWAALGGWVGFFLLWTLFILGWGQGNVSVSGAVVSALLATVPGAILGLPVWMLAGRLEWPARGATFIAAHLVAMIAFAVLWTVTGPVIGTLIEGDSLSEMQWEVQTYVWRLFMGALLYVTVAGLSYAAHINRRLRRQEQIAARAEALAAKANLAAMRSQLRPHFLFNALHSISSLIETEPARATEAMELLGDLLRYTVRERDDDHVALGEEWQFVSDYVDLQRLRFGDRIEISMEADPGTSSLPVPPFVLQPLVENAFVHGLSSRSSGGIINVSARIHGTSLELTVEDNGQDPQSTGRVGANVDGSPVRVSGTGTGLGNLRLRLQSLYGDAATLTIAAREGGGTSARINFSNLS